MTASARCLTVSMMDGVAARSETPVLTDAEARAEAAAALHGSRAIPVITTAPGLEHAAIPRRAAAGAAWKLTCFPLAMFQSSAVFQQAARQALRAAMLHARCVHRDARDRPTGLCS